jgi:hypothetical protein
MGCGHEEHHGGCTCGCRGEHEGTHHFRRRFYSRAERIAELEAYREALLKEAEGVAEAIERLKQGHEERSE